MLDVTGQNRIEAFLDRLRPAVREHLAPRTAELTRTLGSDAFAGLPDGLAAMQQLFFHGAPTGLFEPAVWQEAVEIAREAAQRTETARRQTELTHATAGTSASVYQTEPETAPELDPEAGAQIAHLLASIRHYDLAQVHALLEDLSLQYPGMFRDLASRAPVKPFDAAEFEGRLHEIGAELMTLPDLEAEVDLACSAYAAHLRNEGEAALAPEAYVTAHVMPKVEAWDAAIRGIALLISAASTREPTSDLRLELTQLRGQFDRHRSNLRSSLTPDHQYSLLNMVRDAKAKYLSSSGRV